ncbi:MAG: methylenetetrahydrofolate--tRNA-(uracil(54)-C(5))-methyltransferase (FADH(2)-oxidizing) TrmFO [Tractidigestivibacter sp.]|uniref:methylenetetrahydrofolate--tRNA-(uracil(54)- C(5))-methyltransferase (FADH(2)-oxidizing) TrmFO n=1 Tax=Tractidigestivibacter sp. TaxID=2847320 RepID=UPI002A813A4A|nr:methylenetetrahydrofolate--tRNA-(uracil(54)-C(5))-methyltransferase (FADH(2)-oxidizing) TrmFO [Tractidigestivibacter sp.]MDY4534286.1 methylenetetrahydrofolate--tRNA-(uracil(54)-C(5))-methyltransferase (FADH(2)-oxidizing) TrmFO [Tractidigestivibacter sp.]
MYQTVDVVGAGLAGTECALQLADRGVRVRLHEGRPARMSPAHRTDRFAELVCSNSLKSTKPETAAGVLKWELDAMGCRLLPMARSCSVPAGGALAVDREEFSRVVTEEAMAHPLVEVVREEVTQIPAGPSVIAAGPLCSDALFEAISRAVGEESMSFFDAAAPIVSAESIDGSIAFSQSRYEEGGAGDYLNCPMERDEYDAFVDALLSAERVISRDFEQADLFCACQPIEEVARTGHDSIRFGALKPVGLTNPMTGRRPWAAVQLRAENAQRSAYNLVGFQTNLTWPEQRRVFRMIPGLGRAEFLRYGVMHRNSFVDSPHALDATFAIPGTNARLAGQITGTEGYVEAMASGLLAALNTYAHLARLPYPRLPATGALGSLVAYATDPATVGYQPMHVNFGLVPPLEDAPRRKDDRRRRMAERARADMGAFVADRHDLFADARQVPAP